mmetsp:Transcript_15722/g.29978  ORF Transcript_15722/g.29978 Transcript_15722/m.29978 type:complete len:250 (-) Transcript_15722:162-911(-)|eukprot:scaffold25842_cov198-Amphora_coffeaeformis.AAC.9
MSTTSGKPSIDREASESTMEVVENTDIEMLGKSYKVGDTLESRKYAHMTRSLYGALRAIDKDGDGVIDESEVFEAAKALVNSKKEVYVLRKALLVMLVAVLLVSASTFGVSLWANKLSKDVYTVGDTMTNSHGEVLKTDLKKVFDPDVYELLDLPFYEVASVASLDFQVVDTYVSFQPSVITRTGDTITFKAASGDKVVLTRDTLAYTPWGEEPLIDTKENQNRRLDNKGSISTKTRNPPSCVWPYCIN